MTDARSYTPEELDAIRHGLDMLDGTGNGATPHNLVFMDPHFAKALEDRFGGTVAQLRATVNKATLQNIIAGTPFRDRVTDRLLKGGAFHEETAAAPKPLYFVQNLGGEPFLLREDAVKSTRLACELAFELVEVFRSQLGFLFDECDLTGEEARNLDSYTPAFRAHLKRSIALAKRLGLEIPPPAKPAPLFVVNVAGVTVHLDVAEARSLQSQLLQLLGLHDAK